ncbi:T9SS type A sorting domain-containing protein [Flavobacterium sp. B183]|uniref:T9SS type A sorting domain-containing protein n=1 Tax=Flavobacterium sp. B183 TaxID=907046 RepID=UPI00201F3036|nr:T9SS type A sorting domain-containing protein [Flavobacterium sp. B183]URC13838.1 T9SS type A sorting domain-containing protein [Flavobacterium sp. B183]
MKTKLLLLLFLLNFSLYAQTTKIPDLNFEKFLINEKYDSGVPDGQVLTANISSIKTLNLTGLNINDLTGIGDFKALTQLICSFNNLTSIDVSGNTSLITLNCFSNKLTSLNISKNTALTNLNCATNLITSLDLTANLALSTLNCYDNKLKNLNIAKNLSLKEINCSANDFTNGLVLSNNTALTFINCNFSNLTTLDVSANLYLQSLNCQGNSLKTLDVSKNTNLTFLDCSSNNLTTINLKNGNNTRLTTTSTFKRNPNLTCIQVDNASYSNTNWANLKDATPNYAISCDDQKYTLIPDADFERQLIYLGYDKDGVNGKVLTSAISNVKTLKITYTAINIKDITGIQDFTALESLAYGGNTFKLSSIDLSKNVNLKTLDLTSNSLTTLDLSKNVNLENLTLGSNQLTKLDLSDNTKLKTLVLNNNLLESLTITNNKDLTLLNCYNNKFTTGIDLSQNTLLTSLDLGFNKITSSNFDNNTLLKTLRLSGNKLTSLNLSKNTALESLDCYNNVLTNLDLSANVNLKTVVCRDNQLTNINITKNTLLQTLECGSNKLKELNTSENKELTYLSCLSNSLQSYNPSKNLKLTVLDLGYNRLNNLDVSQNTLLKNLRCDVNSLNAIDVSKNLNLEALSVSNNSIESIDLTTNLNLQSFYIERNKLTSLDLSKNKLLTSVNVTNNLLYDLNLKNGNNKNFTQYTKFNNNLSLSCIVVDDVTYANQNWVTYKDSWANFSTDCRAYTTIPDANFENKLIALKIDTDGVNGKVLTQSIASVKSLDVSGSSIANLTGIQDFAALETLNCKNNQLTYLDFTKNPNLTSLDCSNNKLVSLDLNNEKNTLLNKSTSLFNNNPDLKCIQVDDESYSNTNWANLKDATASYNKFCNSFTAIPDANFEGKLIALGIDTDGKNGKVLSSSIAAVTTLNVSNSNISNLKGIEGFTALKELNVSSNLLVEINLTKNLKLTTLNCNSNKILSLNLSANTELTQIQSSSNNLYSLNLKNGKNTNLTNMTLGNFTNNPSLTCIEVDDINYSTTNWANAKDANANYSVTCTSVAFTIIPDANFEKKLIALKIDTDGVNGAVLTSSINTLKDLNVSDSNGSPVNPIQDLTGIQDFVALEQLNFSYNYISKVDLSKNTALKTLYCNKNRLTELDLSKNTSLRLIYCFENQLTSLDFSNNTAITEIICRDNVLRNLNVTKNASLNLLNCDHNQLTTLDLSGNKNLSYLQCQVNNLTSLDFSNNLYLVQLTCNNNQLKKLDMSKQVSLQHFICNSNQLTELDLTKNKDLYAFNCQSNQLSSIDISTNSKVGFLNVSDNKLTYLNIKNGNNTKLSTTGYSSLDFRKNPDLTCIQVDDVTYSNTNWSTLKDDTATYNTSCGAILTLPIDNFTVESKSESCLNENNGEINITAKSTQNYTAVINSKNYDFTNNSLKVSGLAPGTYKVSITVAGRTFEQNFTITIAKATTVSGKSVVTDKKVNVEIIEGTAPFTVFVNGTEQFQTNDASFSVDVTKNALVEVVTAKACEGAFAKNVSVSDFESQILSAYPNPTSGSFEIEIPGAKSEVQVELYNFSGQLISTKTLIIESGKIKLNLENQPSGIYAIKVYLDTPEYIKIIKK